MIRSIDNHIYFKPIISRLNLKMIIHVIKKYFWPWYPLVFEFRMRKWFFIWFMMSMVVVGVGLDAAMTFFCKSFNNASIFPKILFWQTICFKFFLDFSQRLGFITISVSKISTYLKRRDSNASCLDDHRVGNDIFTLVTLSKSAYRVMLSFNKIVKIRNCFQHFFTLSHWGLNWNYESYTGHKRY